MEARSSDRMPLGASSVTGHSPGQCLASDWWEPAVPRAARSHLSCVQTRLGCFVPLGSSVSCHCSSCLPTLPYPAVCTCSHSLLPLFMGALLGPLPSHQCGASEFLHTVDLVLSAAPTPSPRWLPFFGFRPPVPHPQVCHGFYDRTARDNCAGALNTCIGSSGAWAWPVVLPSSVQLQQPLPLGGCLLGFRPLAPGLS